jgi:hypothetical protein
MHSVTEAPSARTPPSSGPPEAANCPRRPTITQALRVNPDHGTDPPLAKPLQDGQRHILHAAVLVHLRPPPHPLGHGRNLLSI